MKLNVSVILFLFAIFIATETILVIPLYNTFKIRGAKCIAYLVGLALFCSFAGQFMYSAIEPYVLPQFALVLFCILLIYSVLVVTDISLSKQLFWAVVSGNYIALVATIENLLYLIVKNASKTYLDWWQYFVILFPLIVISLPLMCFLSTKVFNTLCKELHGNEIKKYILFPVLVLVINTVFTILCASVAFGTAIIMLHIMLILMPIIVYYFIIMLMKNTVQQKKLMEQVMVARSQLDIQAAQYHKMTERIEQSRKTRHDIRHHFVVLSTLAEDGNLEGICKYLGEYSDFINAEPAVSLCRHYTVDVIVRHYFSIAHNIEIETQARLNIPEKIGIDDVDLCIVFGNCLDNAITACKKVPEGKRYINVTSMLSGRSLVINIENSFDGKLEIKEGELVSQKENGGLGLVNVKAVAQRYEGETSFSAQGNSFHSFVVLSIPKDSYEPAPLVLGVSRIML